jgi:serine/threonine protein phosphatase PrpC
MSARGLRVRFGVATDIGRARERNEDSYLAEEPLFAVADGMGGHRAGDVASALALETLGAIRDSGSWGRLSDQVREANRVVYERSAEDRELEGMGTTLTAVVAEDRSVRLVHVGDSRAYQARDGRIQQLTQDHTVVERLVREGRITAEEAEFHPQQSMLYRALGVEETIPVDEASIDVEAGDQLLLCSDGLTRMVREDEILAILESAPDPQTGADRLVEAANRAGGLDNITVLVLRFEEETASGEKEPGTGTVPARRSPGADDTGSPSEPQAAKGRPDYGKRSISRRVVILWGVAVVAVLVLSWIGVRVYVNSQWFVGVSHGNVAIFNGIPARVFGYDLNRVVQETDLSADRAIELRTWNGLVDGITAEGRAEAEAIVDRIEGDLLERASATPAPPPEDSG